MGTLMTLAQAKTHLRITDSNSDTELEDLVIVAEHLVLEYIGADSFEELITQKAGSPVGVIGSPLPFGSPVLGSDLETADGLHVETLVAASKLVLTYLYDFRDKDPLSDAAKSLLRRWRSPVIA